jgi:hypothetical protein
LPSKAGQSGKARGLANPTFEEALGSSFIRLDVDECMFHFIISN